MLHCPHGGFVEKHLRLVPLSIVLQSINSFINMDVLMISIFIKLLTLYKTIAIMLQQDKKSELPLIYDYQLQNNWLPSCIKYVGVAYSVVDYICPLTNTQLTLLMNFFKKL